jgi:hypothetical protein
VHYVTVFNAATDPLRHWDFYGAGLVGVVVGAALLLIPRFHRYRGLRGSGLGVFGGVVLGFSILWTALSASSIIAGNLRAGDAVRSGKCRVVEGVVQDFHPMPEEGHEMETFKVADVTFGYSDYVITSGFNNAASHGGPIREGLPVRICYLGDDIVKLEIANGDAAGRPGA